MIDRSGKTTQVRFCQDDSKCSHAWKAITFNYKGTDKVKYLCLYHWGINRGIISDAAPSSNRGKRNRKENRGNPLFT